MDHSISYQRRRERTSSNDSTPAGRNPLLTQTALGRFVHFSQLSMKPHLFPTRSLYPDNLKILTVILDGLKIMRSPGQWKLSFIQRK